MEKLPKDQKYYYDVEISKAKFNESASYTLDSGKYQSPYAFENKHIGSNFDDFLKTNNIALKRDINWAVKML